MKEKETIGVDDFLEETEKLLEVAYTNKEMENEYQVQLVLDKLLDCIKKVNFREYTKIQGNAKLKRNHFVVAIIEIILQVARDNGFSLCRKHGLVYVFNGEYWQFAERSEFEYFLGKASLNMGVDKYSAKFHAFKSELYKQFIADAHLEEICIPHSTTVINLTNGTFEISPFNQSLRPFDKDDFLTYQLPFSFNKSAEAPLFNKYLNRVLPERDLQNILAEYLGYIFIKNNVLKLEKVLLLYGNGGNGKSVLFEIVLALFGTENVSNFSLQSLTADNGYCRAMLSNKLLNYASEIKGKLETNIFKLLVSGEPVEARLPFGQPHTINNYARFMFNCNTLPEQVENTNAFFRRFLIIPFKATITENEKDPDLSKRIIRSELSGVFNWVLQGLNRLLENRSFTASKIPENEVLKYQQESDSVLLFLEDQFYQTSTSIDTPYANIFSEYRTFCIESNYRLESKKAFSQKLRKLGYIFQRKNYGQAIFIEKKVI